MEQRTIHRTDITTRSQVIPESVESAREDRKSHDTDLLIGVGAVFLGWAIVASWIFLFVSCITGGRMLINCW